MKEYPDASFRLERLCEEIEGIAGEARAAMPGYEERRKWPELSGYLESRLDLILMAVRFHRHGVSPDGSENTGA